MQNKKLRLFIIFFLYISCTNSEKGQGYISIPQFSEEWKNDSLGCLGLRMKYIRDSFSIIKKFVHKKNTDFIENFGNPYLSTKGIYGTHSFYWIGCSAIPKIKNGNNEVTTKTKINTYAMKMIVTIDNNNIVENINIITP